MMRRIKRQISNAVEFMGNVFHYLARGHDIDMAISLARDTLPR
jgi:hypothetical protein